LFGVIPVKKILVGPAAKHGFGMQGGQKTYDSAFLKDIFDLIITGDPEIVIKNYLENNLKTKDLNISEKRKNAHSIKEYANLGSQIVKQHPYFRASADFQDGIPVRTANNRILILNT